jgi:hypothetical protein
MRRNGEDLCAVGLDRLSVVHDHGAVRDFGNDSHVVREEEDRHILCRALRSSRICAWIVTSSAVVGSSAMSSFGLQASAMAIITRWRMSPEKR